MKTFDASAASAATLVEEWARAGLVSAVLSPGSRSTPLALALAAHPGIRLDVILDERSAAFFALGAAKGSGRPALVLSTSGTAAAHFHPAVLEAAHARVPLLVCTADRPPELRGVGAPQTTDQVNLYGTAVRGFFELVPDAHPGAVAGWRPLAARAFALALGGPAGPVHLNLAYREPLVAEPGQLPPGRADGAPWTVTTAGRPQPAPAVLDALAATVQSNPRGLVVAGWGAGAGWAEVLRFASAAGWPVLADGVSGLRVPSGVTVEAYEALVREAGFAAAHRPDMVLRLGAPLTSKATNAFLDGAGGVQVLADPDGVWLDPARAATVRLAVEPGRLLAGLADRLVGTGVPSSGWLAAWREAGAAARDALNAHLATDGPAEGRVARDVTAALPVGATLVVGSSMPVRDVDAFAEARTGLTVLSNRGLNGIDGFTSTVLGVASACAPGRQAAPVVGLCGDLTFLHDTGGLWAAARAGVDAVLVVVDNDGGGIFSFLPQAEAVAPERFERLFGTPHGLDLVAVAESAGVGARRVQPEEAGAAVTALARAGGGVSVLVVPTGDRTRNAAAHVRAWAAAVEAVSLEAGRRLR